MIVYWTGCLTKPKLGTLLLLENISMGIPADSGVVGVLVVRLRDRAVLPRAGELELERVHLVVAARPDRLVDLHRPVGRLGIRFFYALTLQSPYF